MMPAGGGAVRASDSSMTLEDVVFLNNTCDTFGGAVMMSANFTCKHRPSMVSIRSVLQLQSLIQGQIV